MLTNMRSPETYFQAAFRVQSPWTVKGDNGEEEIIKQECYVFDFALDRDRVPNVGVTTVSQAD